MLPWWVPLLKLIKSNAAGWLYGNDALLLPYWINALLLFCTAAFNPKTNWDAWSGLVICAVAAPVLATIWSSPLGDDVWIPNESEKLAAAPTWFTASNVPEVFTFAFETNVVAVSALPVTSPICSP